MKTKMYLTASALLAMLITLGCSQEDKPDVYGKKTEITKKTPEIKPRKSSGSETCCPEQPTEKNASEKKSKDADKTPETLSEVTETVTAPGTGNGQGLPTTGEVTLKDFLAGMEIPEVVADIDGTKITREQLYNEIESTIPIMMRDKPLPPIVLAQLSQGINMIVDSMVNRQLILGLAEKDGIKPSPELLTERFNDFINKMTPSQKKMIEAQLKEQGTSLEKRREDAAKDINSQRGAAIEQWVDKIIIPEIKIDDESAEKYYRENQSKFKKPETVKVAHILIVPDKPVIGKIADMTEDDKKVFAENADMKAKSQAEAVLAELKQGADFAKLAKEKSICPSKENGGILPDFDRSGAILGEKMGGKMDKTFTDVSYNLKPGDISDVVKTGFGYHIIKSLDHKKESYIPFETVKKFLKDDLKKQQISKKIKTLVDAEREKKKVVNHLKKKTDIPEK